MKPYYKSYKCRTLVNAFLVLINGDYPYDHNHFIKKLSKHSEMMIDHAKYTGYLSTIEEIYNKGVAKAKYQRLFDYK